MTKRFANQVAIVTGGSRGIGRAIAERLLSDGAKVAIFDIDETALKEVETYMQERNLSVHTEVVNVADESAVERAVDRVQETFGRIDILVNNAGILRDNLLFKMTADEWQQVLDVHLNGTFFASRAVQR